MRCREGSDLFNNRGDKSLHSQQHGTLFAASQLFRPPVHRCQRGWERASKMRNRRMKVWGDDWAIQCNALIRLHIFLPLSPSFLLFPEIL